MKTFIVSLTAFCLLISGLSFFTCQIQNRIGTFEAALDSLPASPGDAEKETAELMQIWKETKSYLRYFVPGGDLEQMQTYLVTLQGDVATDSPTEYTEALGNVRRLTQKIRDGERIRIANIL